MYIKTLALYWLIFKLMIVTVSTVGFFKIWYKKITCGLFSSALAESYPADQTCQPPLQHQACLCDMHKKLN